MDLLSDKIVGIPFDERLEAFKSWQDSLPHYLKRGVLQRPEDNVIMVRHRYLGDMSGWLRLPDIFAANLVTNDGAQYYAEKGANATPTVTFYDSNGRFELGNQAQTIASTDTYSALAGAITASRKAYTATYPKTNDGDTDNTGAGVRVTTWQASWAAADFNDSAIQGGVIHDAAGSPVSGSKLLAHWSYTSFAKGSTDTLKAIVNHTLAGV